jgi:hypothetical protein
MTEKIGLIKNPLTIIAIFAGIAEVSGTTVLPFISDSNQSLFIYFLMVFPFLLVIIFFSTLNFNNKVLYAPSDYKDESNYFKIFKYDQVKQENVEIQVKKDETSSLLLEKLQELNNDFNQRLLDIDSKLSGKKDEGDEEFRDMAEDTEVRFLVSSLPDVRKFIFKMRNQGFPFKIYGDQDIKGTEKADNLEEYGAIWIGKNVNYKTIQIVIENARLFYPFLKYLHLSGDSGDDPPYHVHSQIYIGGSTSTAVGNFHLKPFDDNQFEKLSNASSKEQYFKIIRENYLS